MAYQRRITAMGAGRYGQAGAHWGTCLPLKMLQSVLYISGYSKPLSRLIVYALFSQPVVGFWGLCPRPPPGLQILPR